MFGKSLVINNFAMWPNAHVQMKRRPVVRENDLWLHVSFAYSLCRVFICHSGIYSCILKYHLHLPDKLNDVHGQCAVTINPPDRI